MRVSEAAKKWELSTRRARLLCSQNRIEGVIHKGNLYMIPIDSPKPIDGRTLKRGVHPSPFEKRFQSIQIKKEQLDSRRPLTQGELHCLGEEFLIDFTYNSNAIEGNTLTLKETALVLEGMTIDQPPLKDHLEVVGHRDSFLYVEGIAKNELKITRFVIKNIHALVLMYRPDDRGIYRKIPVRIIGATNQPAEPFLIDEKMLELLKVNEKQKKTMHPIERIARFHLDFEGIHPFIDGNGRTGRLLMNLDLIQNGFPPINIKFTDRKGYYDSFEEYYQNENTGGMIELVTGYVEEELDRYLRISE